MIAEIVLVTIIVTSLIRPLLDRVADASGQPASDVPDKPKLPHPTLLKDSKSSSFSRTQTKAVTPGGDGGPLNRSKSFGRCAANNNDDDDNNNSSKSFGTSDDAPVSLTRTVF